MYRSVLVALVLSMPLSAAAQPTDPAPPPPPETPEADRAAREAREAAEKAAAEAQQAAAAAAKAAQQADDAAGAPAEPEQKRDADKVAGRSSGESGFMDVRLNITLTNENVFAEPGETIPSVPGWRFGVPNSLGTLFFDNYDTRFSGYETLSHAVLYRRHAEPKWDVEGALNIRINDLAENRIDLSDAGSYIRVGYNLDGDGTTNRKPRQVSLTAFPTSSDRMRLGYSYRLSWGGSDEYRRSSSSVPGIKVQYDDDKLYAYAGAKSAVVLDRASAEEEAVLGFLFGVGYDVSPMLRVELNGGYFDRGANELQDVITERVTLYGVSAQVALHKDEPVGSSIDYKLYRNDPTRAAALFTREEYPGGLSWLVKAEATSLWQTLKDPAVSGGTTTQVGRAADLNARVKYDRARLRADVQFRDLAFILHSTPSLPTFSEFPEQYDKTANLFAAVGADYNFEGTGVTAGVTLGIDMPATLTTPTGVIPGDSVMGSGVSVAVIRNEGDITILPEGEDALPQLAAKFNGRVDFSEFFAGLVDIYFSRDPNQTRLTRDGPNDLFRREFGELTQLGFNFTLQAKF